MGRVCVGFESFKPTKRLPPYMLVILILGNSGHGLQLLRIFTHCFPGGVEIWIAIFSHGNSLRCGMRYAVLFGYFFGLDSYFSLVWWVGEDQKNKHRVKKHVKKKDALHRLDCIFQKIINYSTLNNVRNWEDMCFMLRNQPTCTFTAHN
jgi:hypothetical protein